MSTLRIVGDCDACGRGPRALRFGITCGLDTFACAECHGHPADAFERDDEYQRDYADERAHGWAVEDAA